MSQAKGLAPLGRLLRNLTNHLCLLHDCLFLCDSSFNFVFSWYSTVLLDISVPNSNFFFLKAFVPLHCLSEERSCLKNICGDCILFISAGSASANRKEAWFCWILQGSIIGVPQLLHYRRCIHWQKFIKSRVWSILFPISNHFRCQFWLIAHVKASYRMWTFINREGQTSINDNKSFNHWSLGGGSIFAANAKLQQPAISMRVGSNLAVNFWVRKGFYFRVSGDWNTMQPTLNFSKKGSIWVLGTLEIFTPHFWKSKQNPFALLN